MAADPGTKKVIIKNSQIGSMFVDPANNISNYYIRYRIVSDDGLLISKWSQTYAVDAEGISASAGFQTLGHTVFSNGETLSVSWHLKENVYASGFDVYVRWNEDASIPSDSASSWEDWTFVSEVESAGASVNIPAGKKWAQVYVQLKTFPKSLSDSVKILLTPVYSTRSSTDSGSITEEG